VEAAIKRLNIPVPIEIGLHALVLLAGAYGLAHLLLATEPASKTALVMLAIAYLGYVGFYFVPRVIAGFATPDFSEPTLARAEFHRIRGILTIGAGVGAGFIVGLHLLFQHFGDPEPQEIAWAFDSAVGALVVSVAIGLWWAAWPLPNVGWAMAPDWLGTNKRRWAREARLMTEESKQRAARLHADPATRKYAVAMRNGERWSDAQIAYDRDPAALLTCAHLQPVERLMRQYGIRVKAGYGGHVDAHCLVEKDDFYRIFPNLKPVYFNEAIPGDRQYDPESAAIVCPEHHCSIGVEHPRDGDTKAPWFPGR
jgi:hypothetical protein